MYDNGSASIEKRLPIGRGGRRHSRLDCIERNRVNFFVSTVSHNVEAEVVEGSVDFEQDRVSSVSLGDFSSEMINSGVKEGDVGQDAIVIDRLQKGKQEKLPIKTNLGIVSFDFLSFIIEAYSFTYLRQLSRIHADK